MDFFDEQLFVDHIKVTQKKRARLKTHRYYIFILFQFLVFLLNHTL
jgi:hypothetical protein